MVSRDEFIEWLSSTLVESIPENFEEFTQNQLGTYMFEVVFSSAEQVGIVPQDPKQFRRASGDIVCDACGSYYRQHPLYRKADGLSYDGQPFLRRLCNGALVKL